jgi:hypothetical protein
MRMGIGLGIGINRSNYAQGIFNAYNSRVVADGGVTEAGGCVDAVAGLLLTASLLLIPSGYKSGKAYAQIPTNGNGDLTWTRASTANRTNSSGNIELMASGVPRLSYMYGSCPALLLEPQRINLALRSEEFDNATWTKSASSITANSVTSPDGTTNADTFESTTNTTTEVIVSQNISSTSGTNYAFTFYVKPNNQNFVFLCINGQGTTNHFITAVFDLSDGTVGQTAVGTLSGTIVSTSIQQASNGFYRLTLVGSINFTNLRARIGLATAKTGNSISVTGSVNIANSLGKSVYIYGSQVEAGAYPTTYIPTTTASATRVADSYGRDNIYTNGLITSSGGTWFIELRNNLVYTRDNASASIFINTGLSASLNDGFRMRNTGSSRMLFDKIVASVSTTLYTTTTDTTKIAIKWNGSTADIFANGTKVVSATSFTATAMENLNGSPQVPIFIQQMALFSTPLSDTDCTTLTTL